MFSASAEAAEDLVVPLTTATLYARRVHRHSSRISHRMTKVWRYAHPMPVQTRIPEELILIKSSGSRAGIRKNWQSEALTTSGSKKAQGAKTFSVRPPARPSLHPIHHHWTDLVQCIPVRGMADISLYLSQIESDKKEATQTAHRAAQRTRNARHQSVLTPQESKAKS